MTKAAIVLTCEKHRHMVTLLVEAASRYLPMPIVVLDAEDRSWESPLPDDVRELIRAGDSHYHVCLRRVFDVPDVVSADTYYILDSDCFLFGPLDDWGPIAFMGSWTGPDDKHRIAVWESIGYEIPNQYPCFCAGTSSYPRQLLVDNRSLAIEFVRQAKNLGYVRPHQPAALDNALMGGLWKLHYPLTPLPRKRYTYQNTTPEMVLYHAGSGVMGLAGFDQFVSGYEQFLETGDKGPSCQFRPAE